VTYCWDNVYISIAVQCDWIYKEDWKGGEVVVAKPLGAGDSELVWYTVLFPR
jgi:hypothetical protein